MLWEVDVSVIDRSELSQWEGFQGSTMDVPDIAPRHPGSVNLICLESGISPPAYSKKSADSETLGAANAFDSRTYRES